jgi:hypothetical protein
LVAALSVTVRLGNAESAWPLCDIAFAAVADFVVSVFPIIAKIKNKLLSNKIVRMGLSSSQSVYMLKRSRPAGVSECVSPRSFVRNPHRIFAKNAFNGKIKICASILP